ncbi:MAG TPA: M20/M25/M40 family metallo-hydrolase [Caldilineaceae bacterium]|nr:M20/M25/M40 family metallo-hydrolase [Caldilineaceae bacterium]
MLDQRLESVRRYPEVIAAAQHFPIPTERLVDLCIAIQQVPAPTGHEGPRAAWVERRLRDLGLAEVEQDHLFNVYGRVRGRSNGPAVLVTAHTDTVFAADTDLSVTHDEANGRIYGPGIGDNSMGVAALLALAEALCRLPPPPTSIWLVANSGEEGLGDLRGMRAVMDRLQPEVGASLVIEGMGLGRIVHRALGSRRYRINVDAPGGHSWSDFGSPSALHVLVQLAAELTRLRARETPRTTFNIGRLEGGTSVNTIAQHAWLELDLRSEETAALQEVVDQALEIVSRYQNPDWMRKGVTVTAQTIGDRPPGEIADSHPLVQAAQAALASVGYGGKVDLRISSTDANIPLSRGIPSVCIGVTEGGNAHRLQEWIHTGPLPQGMAHLLLLTWWTSAWLAGEVQQTG